MIEFKCLENGFRYIEVTNTKANAKVALNGAHLFHYQRVGERELLWLSDISYFEDGKAIRGGIPICWPWFGFNKDDVSLSQHGFARTSLWEFKSSNETTDSTTLVFTLSDTKETLEVWNYKFSLELKIAISDTLTLELKTTNLDTKEFILTQALHTYFSILNISNVIVKGLDKKPYLDALSWQNMVQDGDIRFEREVDRVYQNIDNTITLVDIDREITIKNEGSSSVVVWNPWIEKTKRMSAMKEDAYTTMLCIESANAFDDARVLKPNESHTLKATIY